MKENRGHARCIASGLKYIYEKEDFDYVIPMDGDGEDRPEEIIEFLNKIANHQILNDLSKEFNKYNLDNLVVIIDRNKLQITGKTEDVNPIEPLKDKFNDNKNSCFTNETDFVNAVSKLIDINLKNQFEIFHIQTKSDNAKYLTNKIDEIDNLSADLKDHFYHPRVQEL